MCDVCIHREVVVMMVNRSCHRAVPRGSPDTDVCEEESEKKSREKKGMKMMKGFRQTTGASVKV